MKKGTGFDAGAIDFGLGFLLLLGNEYKYFTKERLKMFFKSCLYQFVEALGACDEYNVPNCFRIISIRPYLGVVCEPLIQGM